MPDRFQPTDVAVVGGGISGLACAFWLKQRGLSVLVFEAKPGVGGCIQSLRTGFHVADGGPQSFIASRELVELVHALQLDDFVETPALTARPYLYHNGRLTAVPQRPQDVVSTRLLSLGGKLRLAKEPFVPKRTASSDESVASFVRRRAGNEVLQSFVDPLVGGIFAGDTAKLSMQSVFPAVVQLEQSHGSLLRGAIARRRAQPGMRADTERGAGSEVATSGAHSGASPQLRNGSQSSRRPPIGFRGGNDALPKVLAQRLGIDVRTGARVKAMWQRGEWLELLLEDAFDTRIVARAIVVATPAAEAGNLLKTFNPHVSAQLAGIGSPPLVQIVLAYPRDSIAMPLEGFGFLAARKEKLRILGCVFNSLMFPDRCPKDQVLLTAFLGGATDPEVYEKDDAELARIAHTDLQGVLKIGNTVPQIVAGFRWPQAIPQYNLGHAQRIQAIEKAVVEIPHLYLCGNYLDGPSVSDCCKRAKTVAHSVAESLNTLQAASTMGGGS